MSKSGSSGDQQICRKSNVVKMVFAVECTRLSRGANQEMGLLHTPGRDENWRQRFPSCTRGTSEPFWPMHTNPSVFADGLLRSSRSASRCVVNLACFRSASLTPIIINLNLTLQVRLHHDSVVYDFALATG